MHHVRALKDLKGKNRVEKRRIAARRKQIPLRFSSSPLL